MENSNVKKKSFSEFAAIKLAIIGGLVIILLLPSRMIESLIVERKTNSRGVAGEVESKWGNSQTVTGPFISVPYSRSDSVLNQNYNDYIHIMPEDLNITGRLVPEIRYRGIYKVILYSTALEINGRFVIPDQDKQVLDCKKIFWDKAMLTVGLPDLRGIREQIRIKLNDKEFLANPGILNDDVVGNGVYCMIDSLSDSLYNFSFRLSIIGKEELNFTPLGKITKVKINSDWNSPSFVGAYLPNTRNISDSGFTAEWSVLDLNRKFPQMWKGKKYELNDESFGLKLMFSVDHYLKSLRSSKYSILFIALTFVVFFFVEILNKIRIHPIQYLFVGAALCIFYTLLVSLSEHMDFNVAYLVSSLAIIILITAYTKIIFKKGGITILLCFVMSMLYGFLFTILQLEDYSLLFGSIALFVVLAVVMFVSRKVNWYSPFSFNNIDVKD